MVTVMVHGTENQARIGPNAIIQTLAVLDDRYGADFAHACADQAGIAAWHDRPPTDMVAEEPVALLFRAIRDRLSDKAARSVAIEAGHRTADYIYANRIPGVAKLILKLLPTAMGLKMLSGAIARHAWTFAGSADFKIGRTAPRERSRAISLSASILPPPADLWYAAVFEALFRRVDARLSINALPAIESSGGNFDYRFVLDR
ncbi:MAG: bacteriochlorophyll 4-vinyl reductase [Alphaproteobacteria bacterium]|nr:bacteriochlorophyll 4-vinyl reductase [Alphaproteobacteria bacterium]